MPAQLENDQSNDSESLVGQLQAVKDDSPETPERDTIKDECRSLGPADDKAPQWRTSDVPASVSVLADEFNRQAGVAEGGGNSIANGRPEMEACKASEPLESTRSPTIEDAGDTEECHALEGGIVTEAPSNLDSKSHGRSNERQWSTPTSLMLRGVPVNADESEVLSFVENCGVSHDELAQTRGVVLCANATGRPSGFAEVHLSRGADFWKVRQRLHMQRFFRGRYIIALPPRPARKAVSGVARHSQPRSRPA